MSGKSEKTNMCNWETISEGDKEIERIIIEWVKEEVERALEKQTVFSFTQLLEKESNIIFEADLNKDSLLPFYRKINYILKVFLEDAIWKKILSQMTWAHTWALVKKILDECWEYLDEEIFKQLSNNGNSVKEKKSNEEVEIKENINDLMDDVLLIYWDICDDENEDTSNIIKALSKTAKYIKFVNYINWYYKELHKSISVRIEKKDIEKLIKELCLILEQIAWNDDMIDIISKCSKNSRIIHLLKDIHKYFIQYQWDKVNYNWKETIFGIVKKQFPWNFKSDL